MPCSSEHLEADARERESSHVLELLKEIAGKPFDHDTPALYYGRVATLDKDTARLCEWCEKNDVTKKSLELQLWWRRHQKFDGDRKKAEQDAEEKRSARRAAIRKLTREERKALGIDERE